MIGTPGKWMCGTRRELPVIEEGGRRREGAKAGLARAREEEKTTSEASRLQEVAEGVGGCGSWLERGWGVGGRGRIWDSVG
ncbi:hypothetical protein K0M31_004238 [Melipona bicolor]|uniref:Uncharacterized protein n=1 Tax=Melipona bicolor TaxID=60889 RepID=A0AA40FWP1_9HYME|nr:hypothetical protein K0M31_004238 [Melipona bicolor]